MITFRAAFATVFLATVAVIFTAGGAQGAFPGADGRIVFVNDRNGSPSIFTMQADGSDIERLVPNRPQGAFPAMSPNGNLLLFSVRVASTPAPEYQLWKMRADGTHVGVLFADLSDTPCASAWSPDGRRIAFYRDGALWIGNFNRTHVRRITDASFSGGAPSWSRRGLIVFDRNGSIWVVNPRTGEMRRLGTGVQPSWSPDGSRLVFVALPPAGNYNDLYVMQANGKGRHRLTSTAKINEFQPAWSPNGRWIAYAQQDGVYLMKANGKKRHLIVSDGREPGWVAGSKGLVFTRQTSRWDGIVLRTDTAGKHIKTLLHPRVDASPSWSPGGTEVAFTRDGVVNLVGADGGSPQSIGLSGSDPSWSPDGANIVVASGLDLVIANADGTDPHPVGIGLDPTLFTAVSQPDWSPDGGKIAFVATETSGLTDLFVSKLKANATTELNVGCDTIGADSPTWSPDGTEIAFACDQSIAITDSTGNSPIPIGSAENASLSWSPDGSQIVYSQQSGSQPATISVVNSDGSVPIQLDTGEGSSVDPDWQSLPGPSTSIIR
jgi:Tol biopolymer transport system component